MTVIHRTKSIKIRVTVAEYEQLQSNKTRSELARWMRESCLSDDSGEQIVKHELPPEVVRVLAGVGGNLNQIAHHLNSQALTGDLNIKLEATALLTQLVATERALNAVRQLIGKKNDG